MLSRLIALTVHLPTSCSTLWVMKTCCEERLHPWLCLHSMPCSYKDCITTIPGTQLYAGHHSPSGLQILSGCDDSCGISTVYVVRGSGTKQHLCATLSLPHVEVQPLFASSDYVSAWEPVGRANNHGVCTWLWTWFLPLLLCRLLSDTVSYVGLHGRLILSA